MNAEELRAIQTPIKERFRESPESARATLSATGSVNVEGICCAAGADSRKTITGLHPMAGGDGLQACAAEMLLEALIGCAGVTFAAVCTAMEIPIESATVRAEGNLDFRGTLGVSRDVPIGFETVRLHFNIQSSAEEGKLTKAVQLAERYCVVAQTLKLVEISWSRDK